LRLADECGGFSAREGRHNGCGQVADELAAIRTWLPATLGDESVWACVNRLGRIETHRAPKFCTPSTVRTVTSSRGAGSWEGGFVGVERVRLLAEAPGEYFGRWRPVRFESCGSLGARERRQRLGRAGVGVMPGGMGGARTSRERVKKWEGGRIRRRAVERHAGSEIAGVVGGVERRDVWSTSRSSALCNSETCCAGRNDTS